MDLITLNQPQYDQNIRAAQTAGFELFTTGAEATYYYPEMPALYEEEADLIGTWRQPWDTI